MTPTITGRVGRKGTALAALVAGAWTLALGSAALATTPTGLTIPNWTTNFTDANGITYSATMVGNPGASPLSTTPGNTNVKVVPIVVKVNYVYNGKAYSTDPTATSDCDTQSAFTRFINSPLFVPTTIKSNGVTVGASTQLVSAYQRANFWSTVSNTKYGVTLATTSTTPIALTYEAGAAWVSFAYPTCSGKSYWAKNPRLNQIDFDAWLQAKLKTMVNSGAIKSDSVPIILLTDSTFYKVLTLSSVGGYHNSMSTSTGTLAYAVGTYEDRAWSSGSNGLLLTGARPDISFIAHEIADLVNDPFQTNSTPTYLAETDYNSDTSAWVCQSTLEVADPGPARKTGALTSSGFTYHYPDVAFHDYFYQTAATGAGGKYSFLGLTSNSSGAACPPSARIH